MASAKRGVPRVVAYKVTMLSLLGAVSAPAADKPNV